MFTLRNSVETEDPPWDNIGTAVWSIVELNTAIICSSLPTLRPLLSRFIPGLSSASYSHSDYKRYGSKSTSSTFASRYHSPSKRVKASRRSISTEELGLGNARLSVASPPAVFVHCSADREPVTSATSLDREADANRQIRITTETSVNY
jgi:hypothetical protein